MYLNSRICPDLYGFITIWLDYVSKKGLPSFVSETDYLEMNHLKLYMQHCQKWIVFLSSWLCDAHLRDPLVDHVHKYLLLLGLFALWHVVIPVQHIKKYNTCLRNSSLLIDKEKISSYFTAFIHSAAKSCLAFAHSQYLRHARALLIKDWHLNEVNHSVFCLVLFSPQTCLFVHNILFNADNTT